EQVLAHVDDVKGAKRKQNMIEHAEDARVSKQLATVQRDVAVDFDIAVEAAPAPSAQVTLTARVRAGSPREIPKLGNAETELHVVVRESEAPEGELFADGPPWRFAVAADGDVIAGDCAGPEEVAGACADRPVVAH